MYVRGSTIECTTYGSIRIYYMYILSVVKSVAKSVVGTLENEEERKKKHFFFLY